MTESSIRPPILRLLFIASLLLVAATCFHLFISLTTHTELDEVSGVWAALALDLVNGVFYRPIIDSDGYGGTRYLPLQFVLHAAFIKLGLNPVAAGHLLVMICAMAMLIGVYALLRRLKVQPALAIIGTTLILASSAVQLALGSIRGDLLSTTLNVWALFFVAGAMQDNRNRSHLWLAALFFVLAFSTKFTTIFGLLAAVVALALAGKRSQSLQLALISIAGIGVSLAVIHVSSNGRALDAFLNGASSGVTLHTLLKAPFDWFREAELKDPWGLFILILAFASLLAAKNTRWRELPVLALGATTVVLVQGRIDW